MMTRRLFRTLPAIITLLSLFFTSTGCQPTSSSVSRTYSENPSALISEENLLAYLSDLTSIQPYSGWRNSASSGEVEALDYVENTLGGFSNLQQMGLEMERQTFKVYTSTEIWDSGMSITLNQQEVEVPAEALRAARYDRFLALYLDSDGTINDSVSNPLSANGSPLVVSNEEVLYAISTTQVKDRILFLDFTIIDSYVNSEAYTNSSQLMSLIDQGLAGLVIVIQNSNKAGESRGSILADGSFFQRTVPDRQIPIVFVKMENLNTAGIKDWDDLSQIESSRIHVDSDVYSPGHAGNVIARIPGADSSKAVILGAHIDSPNGPGAFDDGSGSAALLEIARVIDQSQSLPPVDIYLAWFGGHEIGTYGSAYFAATHQDLLDRTLALYQMDCLGRPMDTRTSKITLVYTSYGRFGDESQPIPDFLTGIAADEGIELDSLVEYGLIADNSNFDLFNVPNINLLYLNKGDWLSRGSGYIHYANHFHDPYETVEEASLVGDIFVEMTKVMLTAAWETGRLQPDLRVPAEAKHKALIVACHTESVNMTTAMLRELGMALAYEGFDVDLVSYGQALTSADLENVDLIILPPTIDYPGANDETWTAQEIALLDEYVQNGGFLVVVNSARNFSTKIALDEINEDSRKLNPLLEPMGVTFRYGKIGGSDIALVAAEHPLTENAAYLSYYEYNGIRFTMEDGIELVRAAGIPLVGLVDYGSNGGQVMVIADIGILQGDSNGTKNIDFLLNIAKYAKNP